MPTNIIKKALILLTCAASLYGLNLIPSNAASETKSTISKAEIKKAISESDITASDIEVDQEAVQNHMDLQCVKEYIATAVPECVEIRDCVVGGKMLHIDDVTICYSVCNLDAYADIVRKCKIPTTANELKNTCAPPDNNEMGQVCYNDPLCAVNMISPLEMPESDANAIEKMLNAYLVKDTYECVKDNYSTISKQEADNSNKQ